jgi:hypothetical protein
LKHETKKPKDKLEKKKKKKKKNEDKSAQAHTRSMFCVTASFFSSLCPSPSATVSKVDHN